MKNSQLRFGIDDLLARADVDAVYIAIPTAPKEETALAAIAAGKHVLVDKPFVNHASLLRMTDAAAAKGVAFMDATHFVLDWTDSLAFKNPDIKTGYFHRTGIGDSQGRDIRSNAVEYLCTGRDDSNLCPSGSFR